MQPIRSIAQIPFERRGLLALLDLDSDVDRVAINQDYDAYGYARASRVWLDSDVDEPVSVSNVLVLAVHAADDGEDLSGDVELEFFVDEVAEDYSVTVPLSKFLGVWLPKVCADESAVVLAMCNPHRATLASIGPFDPGVPIYYPIGDTSSWLEDGDGSPRLAAERWNVFRYEHGRHD